MQILENKDERPLVGESLEQAAPRRMRLGRAVAAGARIGAQPDKGAHVRVDPLALAGGVNELLEECAQFLLGGLGLVSLEDPRLRLRDLAERPVAEAFAVR